MEYCKAHSQRQDQVLLKSQYLIRFSQEVICLSHDIFSWQGIHSIVWADTKFHLHGIFWLPWWYRHQILIWVLILILLFLLVLLLQTQTWITRKNIHTLRLRRISQYGYDFHIVYDVPYWDIVRVKPNRKIDQYAAFSLSCSRFSGLLFSKSRHRLHSWLLNKCFMVVIWICLMSCTVNLCSPHSVWSVFGCIKWLFPVRCFCLP